MKQQSLEEIKALSQGYAAVPVVREILADTATPIGLVSLVRPVLPAGKPGTK